MCGSVGLLLLQILETRSLQCVTFHFHELIGAEFFISRLEHVSFFFLCIHACLCWCAVLSHMLGFQHLCCCSFELIKWLNLTGTLKLEHIHTEYSIFKGAASDLPEVEDRQRFGGWKGSVFAFVENWLRAKTPAGALLFFWTRLDWRVNCWLKTLFINKESSDINDNSKESVSL